MVFPPFATGRWERQSGGKSAVTVRAAGEFHSARRIGAHSGQSRRDPVAGALSFGPFLWASKEKDSPDRYSSLA